MGRIARKNLVRQLDPVHPEFVGDGARRSRRFTVTQSKDIVIFPHLSLGHAEAA